MMPVFYFFFTFSYLSIIDEIIYLSYYFFATVNWYHMSIIKMAICSFNMAFCMDTGLSPETMAPFNYLLLQLCQVY